MRLLLLTLSLTLVLSACSKSEHEPASVAASSPPTAATVVADVIYKNGKIYTVDKARPWAAAVAIKDGKFITVGSDQAVAAVTGSDTEVIDLNGQFAMPGIGDSHIHPALVMPKRAYCGLPGTFYEPTQEQTIDALKECIANYPDDKAWFIAAGFTVPAMSDKTLTREFLDQLIPDRPAFIEDETGGHTAWFNTKAMEAAGVDKNFEDTPDAFFGRTADGDLNGMVYEGGLNPFLEAMPPFDVELKKVAYKKLMDEALSKGITAFGDAYVGVFDGDLQAYEELYQEGKIQQHAALYLKGNLGTDELTPVATLEKWWSDHDLPGIKGVKIGMGGSLESISEALVDGYPAEQPGGADRNVDPVVPAKEFADYVAQLDAAGFQVKVHAIGDGSVRATLDGYESVIKANGNNRLRHHIDHCSLVHPDDFQRFVDLDVSCTIWPPLNAPVNYNLGLIEPVLKPEIWARMYDNRNRLDAGMRLVNHTDAPAATLWPWWGMEASITRRIPGKADSPVMGADQGLTVEELIEAYTVNVAWSLRIDDVTGTIEVGKFADMIILNHNLLEVPVNTIHQTVVHTTLFKGEPVYQLEE
ncbi:MAG: amidohydrolase [Halioglobus sp.]